MMSVITTVNSVEMCSVCGRKMLVSVFLMGVNHNADIAIKCPDCTAKYRFDDEYARRNPEEAERLKQELMS